MNSGQKYLVELSKSLLNEVHGKQPEVYKLANTATKDIIDYIKAYQKKISTGKVYTLLSSTEPNKNIKKITKIGIVEVYISYTYSHDFFIKGKFRPDKTRFFENEDLHRAKIELTLNADEKNIIKYKILLEPVMGHELNHAFVHIKKIGKRSNANVYNSVKGIAGLNLLDLLSKYPPLKEFITLFYLSLPQEVQARVQETATQLKGIKRKTHEETIEALTQYNPLNDAKEMIQYKTDEIKKIDKNIIEDFIKRFNDSIESIAKRQSVNINVKNDIDAFFKHWQSIINDNGLILFRKILKLVADKHNIDENVLISDIYDGILTEVMGGIGWDE